MGDVIVYIPTTKERLRCDECSRSFQTPQGLASHQRNYHPHGCPICEGGDGRVLPVTKPRYRKWQPLK